jgi:murein DD-endopeptidase MepM/ murein hydrolase activator NlpD
VTVTTAVGGDAGAVASTTTTVPPTTVTTTTAVPVAAVHVFPLRPASAGDYSDGHHDYPANDIFCPIGTEVVAVTDGVVDFVSRTDEWDPAVDDPALRGGIAVAIVGDDGVRYYGSHLSAVDPAIRVGARVTAGQRLGLSGDSGNAAGTDSHLHFGISRPTTPEDWMVRRGEVNPYPYLQAWARGEDVTPLLP